jgi:hypothetical protein
VLDLESAVYALAIGMATKPGNTQPLGWSHLSAEKIVYDSLKPLCNIEMLRDMKEKNITLDPHYRLVPFLLHRLIRAWDRKLPVKQKSCPSDQKARIPLYRTRAGRNSILCMFAL